jgi:hypothetical protein
MSIRPTMHTMICGRGEEEQRRAGRAERGREGRDLCEGERVAVFPGGHVLVVDRHTEEHGEVADHVDDADVDRTKVWTVLRISVPRGGREGGGDQDRGREGQVTSRTWWSQYLDRVPHGGRCTRRHWQPSAALSC